ncbi:6-phosphogluconolactonase [Candidatus Altiarchaeota archaeon]
MKRVTGDTGKIHALAAGIMGDEISEAVSRKGRALIGIPGGRSAKIVLQKLGEEDLDWGNIHVFMVDERLVPANDMQANSRQVRECLTDKLIRQGKMPKGNIHFPDLSRGPFTCVKEYTQEFIDHGGVFDVILLSAGEDGHIGSLFPDHPSIGDDSIGYIYVPGAPKPPEERISASRKSMAGAGTALTIFSGKAKKVAYESFNNEVTEYLSCPAKIVNSIKNSYIFTDIK